MKALTLNANFSPIAFMSEPTVATSSSALDPTQRCKIGRAILKYAQGDLTRWQYLDDLTGKSEFSVYDLVFDYSVKFCQKWQGSKCVLLYLPGQLVEPSIANLENGNLELHFQVSGTPQNTNIPSPWVYTTYILIV